jgi:hypothetical protein
MLKLKCFLLKASSVKLHGARPWHRAPESASGRRGASPLQADALRPVTECNCDAAMRGGEQQEVNDQSVG